MIKDIYFLPGTMCNELLWQDLKHLINDKVTINHIELPLGENINEIVDGLLNVLPNKRICLVGFSLGGYIASYFATKFPDRIEKLFIISNTPCALNDNELKQRATAVKWLKQYGYSGISRKKASGMVDDKQQDDQVINKIIEMDNQLGASIFLSQMLTTTKRVDLSQKLIDSKISITFYYSEFDSFINKTWMAKHTSKNENAKVIIQSGSGHMLPLEQTILLKQYIEAWLC